MGAEPAAEAEGFEPSMGL